ncbi:hypothetical protein [Lutibacter sp.]|uniref:hypothetical protein n=1 Tax=Lutibacter sp. TaxID=1925666 RepID=UPI003562AF91
MRKIFIFLIATSLFSCNGKKTVAVEELSEEKKEIIKKVVNIERYVNDIDSYIYHINVSTKDYDSISENEILSLTKLGHITKNISEKDITYKNSKIIKVKYRDFLENNFIKVKSFYYDYDNLICVKIYELLPTSTGEGKIYSRKIYYKNDGLLFDTGENDSKYKPAEVLAFGSQKLNLEYQASLND